jgi:hypothetical protein
MYRPTQSRYATTLHSSAKRTFETNPRFTLPATLLAIALIGCGGQPSLSSVDPELAAAEGQKTQEEDKQEPRCVLFLESLKPDQQQSKIVSIKCAPEGETLHAAASGTLLMTWYEDANFGGWSTQIRGNDGPCDSAGYGIPNLANDFIVGGPLQEPFPGFWNDRISSFKAWNRCTTVDAYSDSNWGGNQRRWSDPNSFGIAVNYVGDVLNDQISSFWIRWGT